MSTNETVDVRRAAKAALLESTLNPGFETKNQSSDAKLEQSDVLQDSPAASLVPAASISEQPKELGGRIGPDPTRYGDWEKNGRCIDF